MIARLNTLCGLRYDAAKFDCADLVVKVQKELFGRDVILPSRRPRGRLGKSQLGNLSKDFVAPTKSPVDGDLVMMQEMGSSGGYHIGVYFHIAYEPYVLHAFDEQGSMLTPIRSLALQALLLEGYYAWNEKTSQTVSS